MYSIRYVRYPLKILHPDFRLTCHLFISEIHAFYPFKKQEFIVFYNGEEKRPEKETLNLSDAYEIQEANPCLELFVTIFNINIGQNNDLVKQCKTLQEYMLYTDRVRKYSKSMDIRTTVNRAVNECINEGILRDFLLKNKSEVIRMSIFEYDEEREIQLIRESEHKVGFEQGILSVVRNMLAKQEPIEKIEEYSGLSREVILQLRESTSYKT